MTKHPIVGFSRGSSRRNRLVLVSALMLLAACDAPDRESAALDQVVRTTFYPTTYFASRIAGGLVPVECLAPHDADPIFWRPARSDLERYQRARLVVLNGAELEKWVATAALPRSRCVDSAASFSTRFRRFVTTVHSHGSAGAHTHEGLDGHTWVDPQNAIDQVRAIALGMCEVWPEHRTAFEANELALVNDLRGLLERLQGLIPRLEAVALFASHPAYDYLMERLGLTITNLDLDPDLQLTERQVATIAAAVVAGRPSVLLWEAEPNPAVKKHLLDEHGVSSIVFDPGETQPPEDLAAGRDYLQRMHENVTRLAAALP